jgi:DNA-3-methyladenine glycosylase I
LRRGKVQDAGEPIAADGYEREWFLPYFAHAIREHDTRPLHSDAVGISLRQTATVADDWRETPVVRGPDGLRRCAWGVSAPEYVAYHDDEWGRPVTDDVRLYEKLCLEGFQSGLSWLTILRKRASFRNAFAGFDPEQVARFGARDIKRLMGDAGIVRHRGKIEATIANARATLEVQHQVGSLAALVWRFEPPRRGRPVPERLADLAAATPESKALAADLRRYGFRFVGPTTGYAAMQSLGLVNDHLKGCHVRVACNRARQGLVVPTR